MATRSSFFSTVAPSSPGNPRGFTAFHSFRFHRSSLNPKIPATPARKLSKIRALKSSGGAASAGTAVNTESVAAPHDARVQKVHSITEFEEALRNAENRLVVVEYAASHSQHSKRIYPFMVQLSRSCPDVKFVLVIGDESEKTKELCKREEIRVVPHFSFYKGMEKIHEEEGIGPDMLMGDVLYYGDNDAPIQQLHGRDDLEGLLQRHTQDHKLVVVDVGLKRCGPCVKVYPTVVKLAKKMSDVAVFARMNGDESEECMQFLKEMDVVEVPTFLFVRDGKILGRYVGSSGGDLIGEVLRYQGVRVTY
eukprot:TRINITY_DN600_c0_g1_i1.p1 TRINITY_DN600_c0_g1~~TRINITY_DN600_c0_g1_i1.p1  ORF type:complete len:307 (+),score=42.76 TRINITY_DN600_c0_g1_i1:345-1265(+)